MNCFRWDSECVGILFENFQHLTTLDLGACEKLTVNDLKKIRQFKDLKSLRFRSGRNFTDEVFKDGLGSSALEALTLSRSPLTDVGLAGIGAHHRRLKTFELVGCANVTDDGLSALLQCSPLLESLELHSNSLGGEFLGSLKNACPQLRTLGIRGRPLENPGALELFMTQRPAVEVSIVED